METTKWVNVYQGGIQQCLQRIPQTAAPYEYRITQQREGCTHSFEVPALDLWGSMRYFSLNGLVGNWTLLKKVVETKLTGLTFPEMVSKLNESEAAVAERPSSPRRKWRYCYRYLGNGVRDFRVEVAGIWQRRAFSVADILAEDWEVTYTE